jgi:DNA polymerase (family 10)
MPVHNSDVSRVFNKIADLLDIEDKNQYRIRAYRNAARTISSLSKDISEMVEKGEDLTQFSGVGKDLAGKIEEIVKTGTLEQLEEMENEIPAELSELMKISDLGPKRVKEIHEELGVDSADELEKAAEKGEIKKLDGFGKKTEKKILEAVKRRKKSGDKKRVRLADAEEYTEPLIEYLKKIRGVKQVQVAGSYRRKKETVGDIDILVTCKNGTDVAGKFVKYEDVDRVISRGKTRSSIVLRNDLQVDLRVVPQVSYGAAMVYFTGSKAHNVELRKIGNQKKLKINEYGVFKDDDRVAGKTEKAVYKQIDLAYVEPELRENKGEIEAAKKNKLPKLVKLKDIKGDLQSHSKASDGKYSLKEMAEAAKAKGYEYLAVTDHSKRVTMANGLDEKRLAKHIEAIDKVNEKYKGFRLLKSVEVDILKDGSLDLSNDILKELDIVVCSIHYNRNLNKKEQTKRVLKAMDNPYFNIMAHPTGRIIGEREPYDIDLEKLMETAKEKGIHFEINAQPDRLDLSDIYAKMAGDMGLKLAISTDAHTKTDLDAMRFGVFQARRAWLEKDDVLNTQSWKDLKKLLKRK